MKRPMLVLWIGLVLGELVGQFLGWVGVILAALLLLVLIVSNRIRRRSKPFFIRLSMIGIAMMFGIISARYEISKVQWLEDYAGKYANQTCQLAGRIQSKKVTAGGSVLLQMNHVFHQTEGRDIYLRGNVVLVGKVEEADLLDPGDEVVLLTMLEKIESPRNPGSFNERIYRFSHNIYLTGYYRKILEGRRPKFSLDRYAYFWKEKMESSYQTNLLREDAAMLKAMVLGDKSDLSVEQKRLYEENGVSHLLAISGLHVSIIGGKIFRWMRKRGVRYSCSCLVSALFLLFYGCMTGFGTSTIRAVTMFFLFLLGQYLGMEYDLVSSMSFTGIWMLLESPYRLMDGGFLISYAAVAAIGLLIPPLHEKLKQESVEGDRSESVDRINFIRNIAISIQVRILDSAVIFLVTAPLVMRFFYVCTPYSVFLNPVVLSCMNLLMISAMAGGILGGIFCFPALLILRIYHGLFEVMCKIPGSLIVTGCPSVFHLLLIYSFEGILFLFWYRGTFSNKKVRRAGILLLVICFLFLKMPEKSLKITMFDVGQGDCILIRMPDGKSMMIDGGSTSEKKIYQNVIRPGLYYYGISKLDYVLITHMDEDHYCGIQELMEDGFPVGHFLMGKTKNVIQKDMERKKEQLLNEAYEHGSLVNFIGLGDSFSVGQVSFQCLHPEAKEEYLERNDESVVLYLEYHEFTALFTGDLGENYEEEMTKILPKDITFLKVAHHGSRYSSSQRFLERVNPRYAAISAGKKNRYGHPHAETVERLQQENVEFYETLKEGAICLSSTGHSTQMAYWKKKHF